MLLLSVALGSAKESHNYEEVPFPRKSVHNYTAIDDNHIICFFIHCLLFFKNGIKQTFFTKTTNVAPCVFQRSFPDIKGN